MPQKGKYDPTYPKKLNNIGIGILGTFTGANKHHKLKCLLCGNIWKATPKSKLQNFKKYNLKGCPNCTKKNQEKRTNENRQKMIIKLKERFDILSDISDLNKIFKHGYKIKVRNKDCGHEFKSRTKNLASRDVICPICNTKRKRKQFQTWTKEHQIEYRKTAAVWDIYRHDVYMETRRSYKKHKKIINPQNFLRGRAGQKDAYHLDHIVSVRYCFENNIPVNVCGHPQNLQMVPWLKNIQHKDKIKENIPAIFYPYISNRKRIDNFINAIKTKIEQPSDIHSRVLDPYPITIYYPNLKLGILFCPLDEYSESKTSKYYFSNMLKEAEKENIRILIIFEDEWNNTTNLVISKIKHYAGMTNAKRLYARKCECRYISSQEKGTFLNDYHIQQNDNSSIYLGAFYENELVAVMTFAKPRVALGGKNNTNNEIELVRFTTKIDYHIIGIASKLLKFFERNEKCSSIYSFADKRWSIGNVYEKLNFVKKVDNPPDYFYIINNERKHRWNYRKDILKNTLPNYDKTLTEYDNMKNAGYDRIWGCGTIKYVKSC